MSPRPPTTDPENQPVPGEVYTGVLQANSPRGGFIILEDRGLGDVFVPFEFSGSALHGDQVRVLILRERSGRACEGKIERVLKRANRLILGQLRRSGKKSIVTPKNPKLRRLIEIPRQFSQEEVPDGAWVIAEIRQWSEDPHEPLTGKLNEVIGVGDDERLPILLLIREGGIQPEFPPEVEAEAAEIHRREITEREIERRRDFRGQRVVTIDPATAKDFDDAVSLVERVGDGWRVAVHIADVAHYVPPGSKIDKEAYERATSIYPVDRVIPMLPEALSNERCSLRPGEDKLTMTAVFTVGATGAVRDVELCESVIHSVRRFAYEEVQAIFDEADKAEEPVGPAPKIPEALRDDLMEIRRASAALFAARMRRGALDLDMPEMEAVFNERGIVVDLRRKERLESHRLIEDLMLAANEAVARELAKAKLPFLYRVHESPNEDKLAALAPAFARFGIHLPSQGKISQSELQAALARAREHPAAAVVQRLVLRSMKRAAYQPENVGHFGLASACYCHFTSPIRRYPDLIVHRAVKALLNAKDAHAQEVRDSAASMEEWGRHTSSREERAQRIEWDAQKIVALEFMTRFVGDVFEGFIGGLMSRGFFVELVDYPAEGMVPIRSIEDDYYDLDPDGIAFYGRRTNKSFALGDKVTVQIEKIDVMAGEMDLRLVRKEAKGGKGGKGGSPRDAKGKGKGKGKGKANDWRQHMNRRRGK